MTSRIRQIASRLWRGRSSTSDLDFAKPELSAFDGGQATTRLQIDVGDLVVTNLLLVGRKSGLETSVDLPDALVGSGHRTATIDSVDLGVFSNDIVDLFVQVATDGVPGRHRLSCGWVDLHPRRGALYRWYSTSEGNVSVRRLTATEVIREAGVFDVEHYRSQTPRLPADVDEIGHYVSAGAAEGLNPSPMFDTSYYRRMNPSVRRQNPLAHYCEVGWRELRNPSPLFDTWWYWYKHLDPSDDSKNPLAHYEASGKQQQLSTRPDQFPSRRLGVGHRFEPGQAVRRICLFAGYDPDGLVDPYVVDYVRELAEHADVYYLADCPIPQLELAKLAPYTKAVWAERHGHYDFGSYARLIEKIGWSEIERYDELLLVNDSCYLLRPLDDVFSRMSARACDWWGLQATKGLRETRSRPTNQFREPIDLAVVRSSLVDSFEQDYTYDFLIGSYFLAFRRPVFQDGEFRRYVTSVTTHERKRDIVKKYEVGLTRWLIQHGHVFDTYVPKLYPFHPIFTLWFLRLLDEGFPLLKRYFLAENHYGVPRLSEWPELIRARVPEAKTDVFERNLIRVSDPDRLRRSLTIGAAPPSKNDPVFPTLLSPAEFMAADRQAPKYADWWAFPTDPTSGLLTGNQLALFEHIRDDSSIHKIILARDVAITLDGPGVDVVPLHSALGQHRLLRSGTILITSSCATDVTHPVSSELHNLIHVGDDVPFARTGYAVSQTRSELGRVAQEQSQFRALISSSRIDMLAKAAGSYPLTVHQIWSTGLPRHDFIVCPEGDLPRDLRRDLDRLRDLVGSRTLVLLIPARRGGSGVPAYQFTAEELERLDSWLRANDVVLGVREDSPGEPGSYFSQLPEQSTLDLSPETFLHVEPLHRLASAMITDYSSAFVDFLLTGRPVLSFAHDYDSFQFSSGGTFYDLATVFPGPVCRTFEEFQDELRDLLGRTTDKAYEAQRRIFFDHLDDRNTARAIEKIRELTTVHGIGSWSGERIA